MKLLRGSFSFFLASSLTLSGFAEETPTAAPTEPASNTTAVVEMRESDPILVEVTKSQPELSELDKLIDRAIEVTSKRYLVAESHSPWQIAHGVLALRKNYLIKKNGEKVNALEWIATGPSYRGRPWFLITPHGAKGHPFTEPMAFEGHPNQFLALFTLSRLPLDAKFETQGKPFTMGDLINNAKMEVNSREEITWTLWALSYYLDPDAQWVNQHGEHWSIERLVQMQIASPVTESACGGNHGLFAVASARNSYLATGQPLRGTWLEAHMHLERYTAAAKSLQNSDGSFSANYFRGPEYTTDFNKRLATTGHTLEFLMVALPQKSLANPWVQNAARAVARDLVEHRKEQLEPGGMYHSLSSIVLYRERTRPESLAREMAEEAGEPVKSKSDEPEAVAATSETAATDRSGATPVDEAAAIEIVPAESK